MASSRIKLLAQVDGEVTKKNIPAFGVGDTVRVHARIVEGNKERIQVYEGIVIRRTGNNLPGATFTVRKVSYNVGVERIFPVHSPRVERIELVAHGKVRRSRLYYLRNLRGKASRVSSTAAESVESEVESGGAKERAPESTSAAQADATAA